MADIIDITGRKSRKSEEEVRRKLEATRRIFLCSGCPSKCAKCGMQLDVRHESPTRERKGYNFCDACLTEWGIFQKIQRGEPADKQFYHNEQWIKLWQTWLEYQKALKNYRNSKEFQQLLLELEF